MKAMLYKKSSCDSLVNWKYDGFWPFTAAHFQYFRVSTFSKGLVVRFQLSDWEKLKSSKYSLLVTFYTANWIFLSCDFLSKGCDIVRVDYFEILAFDWTIEGFHPKTHDLTISLIEGVNSNCTILFCRNDVYELTRTVRTATTTSGWAPASRALWNR